VRSQYSVLLVTIKNYSEQWDWTVMKKYVFKPYNKNFPTLFSAEKMRIADAVQNSLGIDCVVEHVGSTAVPGLGGKGIIDSAIATHKTNFEELVQVLTSLGYVLREQWSTPERWFLRADLADPEEGVRRYHVHVTFSESSEWKELIAFRDYLRENPSELQRYAGLKQNAAMQANEDGAMYRKLKVPLFADVLKKIKKLQNIKKGSII